MGEFYFQSIDNVCRREHDKSVPTEDERSKFAYSNFIYPIVDKINIRRTRKSRSMLIFITFAVATLIVYFV